MRNWLVILPAVLLTALLIGCAQRSIPSAQSVLVTRQVQLPPLPASARQPSAPSECLPSCTSALTSERERSANLLMPPKLPASSAK